MRNRSEWRVTLAKQFNRHWREEWALSPTQVCEIELALFLANQISPQISAAVMWAVLAGHPLAETLGDKFDEATRRKVGTARHLLLNYRTKYQWTHALKDYVSLPESVRGFDLRQEQDVPIQRVVSDARFDIYTNTLNKPVPFQKDVVHWAGAGDYKFKNGDMFDSVTIPPELARLAGAKGHSLSGKRRRDPICVSREDLLHTARWMDEQLSVAQLSPQNYAQRLSERVQHDTFDQQQDKFVVADALKLDGLTHMVGMVGTGKSTLMEVLAVWAAKQKLHITIVVNDVVSVLSWVQRFRNLGLSAAPILGSHSRETHLKRLHRAQDAVLSQAGAQPFQWVSSVCPLDGLRAQQMASPKPSPLALGDEPCDRLQRATVSESDEPYDAKRYSCPLFAVCPKHFAQRELVEAHIWVATPASLVHTRVAAQLNPERLRFLELVYRRSDIVLVDEADLVQMQLDNTFSPSLTLVGQSEQSWLHQVWEQLNARLTSKARVQLRERGIAEWCQASNNARTATDRLYELLVRNEHLRKWVTKDDRFFNDIFLWDRLARELSGVPVNQTIDPDDNSRYKDLREAFAAFLRDPLGVSERSLLQQAFSLTKPDQRQRILSKLFTRSKELALRGLAQQLLTNMDNAKRMAALRQWVEGATDERDTAKIKAMAERLEITLIVALLQYLLDVLMRNWQEVASVLQFDTSASQLFQSPPNDFVSVIPAAPMGNVLAFQYAQHESGASGDLTFFRCAGMGRWLLLNLPRLFEGDGIAGPHTLLLSGTSWAGKSPAYHVVAPVQDILRAPKSEVDAIAESEFVFDFVTDSHTGKPIRISGLQGDDRANALGRMMSELARKSAPAVPSLLEQERDRLDKGRQRILLVVGSYRDADAVYTALLNKRPEWERQVLQLARDDDEVIDAGQIRRGAVGQFAKTDAWLLIAPLLAIERGHNILNDVNEAALGAVHFLVRPHPIPNDISLIVYQMNRWALEQYADWTNQAKPVSEWNDLVNTFRQKATMRWRRLLTQRLIFSRVSQQQRNMLSWNLIVNLCQTFGRVIRGGRKARVVFRDFAFSPIAAPAQDQDDEDSSKQKPLGVSAIDEMRAVLHAYHDVAGNFSNRDYAVVNALYGAFYKALKRMV